MHGDDHVPGQLLRRPGSVGSQQVSEAEIQEQLLPVHPHPLKHPLCFVLQDGLKAEAIHLHRIVQAIRDIGGGLHVPHRPEHPRHLLTIKNLLLLHVVLHHHRCDARRHMPLQHPAKLVHHHVRRVGDVCVGVLHDVADVVRRDHVVLGEVPGLQEVVVPVQQLQPGLVAEVVHNPITHRPRLLHRGIQHHPIHQSVVADVELLQSRGEVLLHGGLGLAEGELHREARPGLRVLHDVGDDAEGLVLG
mmetsp:Transcript_7049/g.17424  ORF Transcript_7049/g.17424 Transcript_7049/m.17424 type:complete len:247 (-) Transcript_7049:1062-1802(-)